MSTEGTPGVPAGPPSTPPTAPPQPTGVDPAQYEEQLAQARQRISQYEGAFRQLSPFADDIDWLTQDPENAKFLRESRRAYEEARKARAAVPAEMQPVVDKLDKLEKFVDTLQAQQQYSAQTQRAAWMQEGEAFLLDQAKKHPEIKESLPEIAMLLGRLCDAPQNGGRGLTFDEGWQRLQKSYVTTPSSGPPPPSMRADAGFAGLPPPSRQPTPTGDANGKSLGNIVLERMRSLS